MTTVDIRYEEQIVNSMFHKNRDIMIIVYGKNSNDITILHKYEQLVKLGFTNVHIYTGGIFEWMLLYEIYGKDLFKITRYEIDILRYRPKSVILAAMAGGAGAGAYIEDDLSQRQTVGGGDVRLDIHPEDNDTSAGSAGGILSTGIKWLFGA
jgi:hypothetical protein